jgi:energy-coupling factor transport system ATP-binding protein
MEPKYLILDEPTAGLDPRGRDEILAQIELLHHNEGITVVLVSHSMDDVARLADRLIVINQGEIIYNDAPRKVFMEYKALQNIGLDIPTVGKLMLSLKDKGWPVRTDLLNINEAKEEILKVVRRPDKDA